MNKLLKGNDLHLVVHSVPKCLSVLVVRCQYLKARDETWEGWERTNAVGTRFLGGLAACSLFYLAFQAG